MQFLWISIKICSIHFDYSHPWVFSNIQALTHHLLLGKYFVQNKTPLVFCPVSHCVHFTECNFSLFDIIHLSFHVFHFFFPVEPLGILNIVILHPLLVPKLLSYLSLLIPTYVSHLNLALIFVLSVQIMYFLAFWSCKFRFRVECVVWGNSNRCHYVSCHLCWSGWELGVISCSYRCQKLWFFQCPCFCFPSWIMTAVQ